MSLGTVRSINAETKKEKKEEEKERKEERGL